MRWTVCHGGATFSKSKDLSTKCASALQHGKDALGTVALLEHDGSFNAGCGSSLNWEGNVECEAGVMYSDGRFGGVAGLTDVRTPSQLAASIAENRASTYGLVAPNFLIGLQATKYAKLTGIPLCSPGELISQRNLQAWAKAKAMVEKTEQTIEGTCTQTLDTVGAIEIDDSNCIACSSSGGIMLKHPGRVGHSAIWGAGVWAENRLTSRIAVAITGLGEAIVRCRMAQGLAETLLESEIDQIPTEIVSQWLDLKFINSKWMQAFSQDRLIAGGIILLQRDVEPPELVVFNNSPFLPVAYTNSNGKVKTIKAERHENHGFTFTSILL